jgi:hypothetical protein
LLKGDVIPAARHRPIGARATHRLCSGSFRSRVMEIKIMLPGNDLQHIVVYLEIYIFSLS